MTRPHKASIQELRLIDVYPNPEQPRKRFDQDALAELADSIAENGLIQPITVVSDQCGMYMIVAGERRYRAHKLLEKRGLTKTVSCIVQRLDDAQVAINAIIENDQRLDVSLMEQARSYKRMIDVHGLTIEELARKLGKRASKVQEVIGYNRLSVDYQDMLDKGHFCMAEADALAGLSAKGQDLLFQQMKIGRCNTVRSLRAIAQTIADAEAQTDIFGEGLAEASVPAATVTQINSARSFEGKVESLAAFLRQGIDDNTVTAVRKVNPGRAGTIAELLFQMQRDLYRIESAFRVAAAVEDLAA
jgi:ParB family transcriptional regulator, chromosome partitioning protein